MTNSRFAKLDPPDGAGRPTGGSPLTRLPPMLRNIILFVATMAGTVAIAQGAKSYFGGRPEYVLTATRDIAVGEPLSSSNAEWRASPSHLIGLPVKGGDKNAAITGYIATDKITAGKPVLQSAVASRVGRDSRTGDIGLTGYILGPDDLGEAASYLNAGDHVDLIGVVNPSDKHGDFSNATVATLVRGAEVTSVTHPLGQGRVKAVGASAVVGVTEEQARLLGVLKRFGSIEVTLSPRRLAGWEETAPDLDWVGLDRLGLSGAATQAAEEPAPRRAAPQMAAVKPEQETARPAEPASESVEVLLPGGSQVAHLKN